MVTETETVCTWQFTCRDVPGEFLAEYEDCRHYQPGDRVAAIEARGYTTYHPCSPNEYWEGYWLLIERSGSAYKILLISNWGEGEARLEYLTEGFGPMLRNLSLDYNWREWLDQHQLCPIGGDD